MFALDLLATNAYVGQRGVIDVSGDGRANQGELPTNARARALAEGVTVNGLAILNEDPALNVYYLQYVIAGPGAFVLAAQDYEAFADAIVEKLVREISGAPVAGIRNQVSGIRFQNAGMDAGQNGLAEPHLIPDP
jgi:hypothetical protein